MNSPIDPSVQLALDAITDDVAVDWNELESRQADADVRDTLGWLRVIARVAHAPEFAPTLPGGQPSACQLRTPCTWGLLHVIEPLGRGAYGEVYRAWDPRLEREVALKLIVEPVAEEGSLSVREGRLLARLRHPNVVAVYGADVIGDHTGIWMELVHGATLDSIVRSRGRLSVNEAVAAGIAVCRALTAVHAAGLIHGDVKAQNVMREDGDRIVLMDFGTGRLAGDRANAGGLAGTPLYLAPEVLERAAADARADIYSAGVLLYFLLTGAYPVEGRTLDDVRAAHASGARTPMPARRAGIPPRLVDAVERAMARNPSARFDNAAALEQAVADAVANGRAASGRRVAVSIAASVLVVTFAGVGWRMSAPFRPKATSVETVTTASPDARRLYDDSYDLGFRYEWPPALALAKQAVAADDNFALAHTWEAWCLWNTQAPPAVIVAEGKRAVDLSSRVSEWERLWIDASYDHFTHDAEKEIVALKALLRLRPDHYWAVNNLVIQLRALGREREALPWVVRLADLRPTDGLSVSLAARELMMAGDTDNAVEYARRARTIIVQRGWFAGGDRAWTLPIEALWRRGDIRGAAAALDAASAECARLDTRGRLELGRLELDRLLVTANLSLGRTRAAADVADLIPNPNERHFNRAIVAFHGDRDRSRFRSEMDLVSNAATGADSRGLYLVESGRIDQAQWELDHVVGYDPGGVEVVRGRIALARGEPRQALALLQRARPGATVTQAVYRFEYLADLYLRQGDRQQAIATLQESLHYRSAPFLAIWWMRNELRLAELYYESGHDAEASPLEAELDALLAAADPDFPLLVRLKALEARTPMLDAAKTPGGRSRQ